MHSQSLFCQAQSLCYCLFAYGLVIFLNNRLPSHTSSYKIQYITDENPGTLKCKLSMTDSRICYNMASEHLSHNRLLSSLPLHFFAIQALAMSDDSRMLVINASR